MEDFHGRDQTLNQGFEDAKKVFDSQSHESMTRKHLTTDEVKRMVDPKIVIATCLFMTGVKKTVDKIVT